MIGPTLTMAPAIKPSGSFHRSHSSSDLLGLSRPSPSPTQSGHQRTLSSKSLPSLPAFDIPAFDSSPDFNTTLYLESMISDPSFNHDKRERPQRRSIGVFRREKEQPTHPDTAQKSSGNDSVNDRRRSWLPSSKSASNFRDILSGFPAHTVEGSANCVASPGAQESKEVVKPRAVSGSFATFARRSWISDSRSPSPQRTPKPPKEHKASEDGVIGSDPAKAANSTRNRVSTTLDLDGALPLESSRSTSRALNRASIYLTKMKQKPSTALVKLGSSNESEHSSASSSTSLGPLNSHPTGHRPSQSTSTSESNGIITDDSSVDMAGRSRDPLWSTFRDLETDFSKFELKPVGQRPQLIRSSLLPFLNGYGNHSSSMALRPEDVDRRATILQKWWSGLLDLLDGRGLQLLAGVDRMCIVEAATLIMMRPEWRQTTSYLMPLADRSPAERVRARSWTNSTGSTLSSSEAAFLAESAEHNVRTMFVSNLVRQMELVVNQMSRQQVAPGLVNFCGKACAYAFFFAPGVADMLVRLWDLSAGIIQRVADELGLPRKSNGESEDIVALFPPNLGSLGWSSVRSTASALKRTPKVPLGVSRIRWHGRWVPIWQGRDTDLFFVFCKHFHILAADFMPAGLPLLEKARAPAFVLVHAQLLSIMDTTIHRRAALEAFAMAPIGNDSFGADASATALPALPGDLLRGMSENRLIILLKDFLSESSVMVAQARHTFAETFMSMMKAAARRTAQFNHNACHTLCDFLEEALIIYDGFVDVEKPALEYIDWNFWFEACKLILSSLNAMSEMRMLCFIYSIWDAVSRDPKRKESLCLDWLLAGETFHKFFSHWCPMVRAYYMRLLCWRVCRDTGSANEVDSRIFITVAERLKTVWTHYLYLKQDAESQSRTPPSTAPSYPTPGKKFMIIRAEVNVPQPGLFMGFDPVGKPQTGGGAASSTYDETTTPKADGRKRWSLLSFSKVLSFNNDAGSGKPTFSTGGTPKPRDPPNDDFQQVRRDLAALRQRSGSAPPPPPKATANAPGGTGAGQASDGSSTGSSPVFDAQQYIFRFVLHWYPPAALPSVNRILTRPRLPAPAQSWVSARSRNGSHPTLPVGLPAPTRRISGSPQIGLIKEARNASPLQSPGVSPSRTSFSSSLARAILERSDQSGEERLSCDPPRLRLDFDIADRTGSSTPEEGCRTPIELLAQPAKPVKPVGTCSKTAVYAGRALAEWAIVVNECNSFIERRREEGVLGLSEVEVPTLAVEGYRRIG